MPVFGTNMCQNMKACICINRNKKGSDKICSTERRQEKLSLQLEEGIVFPLGLLVCLFMSQLKSECSMVQHNRTERLQTQVDKGNRSYCEIVLKNKLLSYTRRMNVPSRSCGTS